MKTLIATLALATIVGSALGQAGHDMSKMKPGTKMTTKSQMKGAQLAIVTVDGGYKPSSITVKKGRPVHLTFVGKRLGCGNQVVSKQLGINKKLAQGKRTTVMFTPRKAGTYTYTCGMGMYKGKIVVK